MPLRVLVDAVSARVGGGGTYIVAQMEALARSDDICLTILASGAVAERLAAACPRAVVRSQPILPVPLRLLWEQLVLPIRARDFDVVYMPGNFALLLSPHPQVVTAQNAWYFSPETRAFRRRHCPLAMRLRLAVETALARLSIERADCVVAVSHSMLSAIEQDLGPLPHARVIVTAAPPLADPGNCASGDKPPPRVASPYALVVSHDDPHKEWDHLIDTFLSHPDLPRLVIAGRSTRQRMQALSRWITGRAPGRVVLLGTVAERSALAGLYRGAACCIVHSRFESFGLTACEALSQGTPVVATDIAAHREVCGSAAVYYEAANSEALAEAVRSVAGRVPRLPEAPLRRTWRDNAEELRQVFLHVAGRAPVRASARLSAEPRP